MKTVATEIRIHADNAGKYQVPPELKGEVTYGRGIRAIAAFLYSEGVVVNDRICTFLNSISGERLNIAQGSIYHFCKDFSSRCREACSTIENDLLNAPEICTDAATVGMENRHISETSALNDACSTAVAERRTWIRLPVFPS